MAVNQYRRLITEKDVVHEKGDNLTPIIVTSP